MNKITASAYQSIRGCIPQHSSSFIKSLLLKSRLSNEIKKPAKCFYGDYPASNSCRWNDLSADILEKIAIKLCIGDRIRMAAVSKSWNQILNKEDIQTSSEDPWLLMPRDPKDSQHVSLYSLSEARVYKFRLIKLLHGGWCCGTSRGWLVMVVAGKYLKPEMFLWNPISGSIIGLPSIETVPCFSTFKEVQAQFSNVNVSCFIRRVEVFSVGCGPDKRLVVAAIFVGHYENVELAFCRPQDTSWSIYQAKYISSTPAYYNDILYYKGILYGLICRGHFKVEAEGGVKEEKDAYIEESLNIVGLTDCEVQLRFIVADYTVYSHQLELERFNNFSVAKSIWEVAHLAESGNGKLLLIKKIHDVYSGMYEENDAEGPIYMQTRDFTVEAINLKSYKDWKSSTSLGEDQALFIATSGSLSCYQKYGSGNRIYFLAEQHDSYNQESRYVDRESGVFYLPHRRIMRSFPSIEHPTKFKIGWFTPRLHP